VNKLYVYNTYTFIQFVPMETTGIEDVRPDNLGKADRNGYYEYDKQNYYNDDFHQSFVIENSTGNIYSLATTVYIDNIHNGLLKLKDNPYIYDLRVKTNEELEIFSLFQNNTVIVYDYYKDKYGNNYIFNNILDIKDIQTNTIFHKDMVYQVALNTGEVVFIEGNFSSPFIYNPSPDYSYFIEDEIARNYSLYLFTLYAGVIHELREQRITRIQVMGKNCTPRPITNDDYLQFNGFTGGLDRGCYFSHIKNKSLYTCLGNSLYYFVVFDIDTAAIKHAIGFNDYNHNHNNNNDQHFTYIRSILFDTVLIDDYENSKLYFYKVDFDSLPVSNIVEYFAISLDYYFTSSDRGPSEHDHVYGDGLKLLLEGYDPPGQFYSFNGIFTITTINSRDEYTVVLKDIEGEKVPVVVKTSEYVAEEQQIITLKPINR
jgi:hypothetical protein